jgi:hypothetical protein
LKAYFQVIDVSAYSSSDFTKPKIRFVRGLVSDNQSNRLSVGTHILPLNKQKMRFVKSQERNCLLDPLAQFIHVLPFTLTKILFGCRKEIEDSGDPQVQQGVFGLLVVFKTSLVELGKTNIEGVV